MYIITLYGICTGKFALQHMLLGYRKVFMMKLLTITVPSYNSEAYLDRCMATLLPGGDEVEILIVDDGSTDRTAEIADEYERKYPNIVRAIHKENGGHGDAVTTGIRNATGLFFKVVDSDDSLAPEAYKQVLDFLRRIVKKNHELDMLISNFVYDRHDENGDVLRQKSIDYRKTLPRGRFFSWKEIGKFQTGHYLLMPFPPSLRQAFYLLGSSICKISIKNNARIQGRKIIGNRTIALWFSQWYSSQENSRLGLLR